MLAGIHVNLGAAKHEKAARKGEFRMLKDFESTECGEIPFASNIIILNR